MNTVEPHIVKRGGKETLGIYVRVSSSSQKRDGYSPQTQMEDGIKYCNKNNYNYEVFEDVISGSTVNRKGFDQLHYKIRTKELKGVYVRDFNRIIRGTEIEFYFQKMVEDSKCVVIEDGKIIDFDTLSDVTYFHLKSMLGKIGRNEIKINSRRGVIESLKKGKVRGNRKFGYNKVDGVPSLNEKESIIVKDFFKCFLQKSSTTFKSYCNRMNKKHNTNFSDVNFKRLLSYEGYKGRITQKYEEFQIETEIPQIIDEYTFNLVQNKLDKLKNQRKGRDKYNYLLKGKVFCGNCKDTKLWKRGSKNPNGLYHYYFVCKNYGSKGYKNHYTSNEEWDENQCKGYKGNNVNFSLVEDVIWEFIYDFSKQSKTIQNIYQQQFLSKKSKIKKDKSNKRYYEIQIEEVNKKKFDTYNQYLDGKITIENFNLFDKRFDEEIERLTNRKDSLNQTISLMDNSEMLNEFLNYFTKEIDYLYNTPKTNFKHRKQIIDKYIDRIDILRKTDNEYLINVNFVFQFSKEDLDKLDDYFIELQHNKFYIRNTELSSQYFYIVKILLNQLISVKFNIKHTPNQRSLYNYTFEKLKLVFTQF